MNEKMDMTKKLGLSIKEMAEALGIGYSAALMLTRQSGFPTVKVGKRRIVPVEQLRGWLEREAGK